VGWIRGEGLGNIYDRVLLVHVVYSLVFYWGNIQLPAFDIADSASPIGAGLILLDMLLGAKKHD